MTCFEHPLEADLDIPIACELTSAREAVERERELVDELLTSQALTFTGSGSDTAAKHPLVSLSPEGAMSQSALT